MNDVQSVSQSLPANKVSCITLLCMLKLTVIHASWHICQPKLRCHTKNTRCRLKEATLYNQVARYSEDVGNLSVHICRFFQPSLVSLTGSDVAILTVEMFCPFSAPCVTPRPLTLLRKPPQSMLGLVAWNQEGQWCSTKIWAPYVCCNNDNPPFPKMVNQPGLLKIIWIYIIWLIYQKFAQLLCNHVWLALNPPSFWPFLMEGFCIKFSLCN